MSAGMSVLAHKGPDGATVGEIARTARVATGTFYNHFPSIGDLVVAVTDDLSTGVRIGRDTLEAIEHDPAVRVVLGTEQLLDLAEDDPEAAAAFVALLATVPDFRDRVRSVVGGAIEDGITAGRFAERPVPLVTDALLGSVIQWMRTILNEPTSASERDERLLIALSIVGVAQSKQRQVLRKRPDALAP